MSKLYTEEQVRIIANQVRINGFWNSQDFTPIQLPSDDELRNNSPFKNATDYTKEEYCNFMNGAKWMRDKIKGGQDEKVL